MSHDGVSLNLITILSDAYIGASAKQQMKCLGIIEEVRFLEKNLFKCVEKGLELKEENARLKERLSKYEEV